MLSKATSRIALASASALIAAGVLAVPAFAQASPIGPRQYFNGEVFGIGSSTTPDVIAVACAGPETTGHPAPGQYVAVRQIFPPVTTTVGYTGDFGTEISANLTWSRGTITVVTHIATFTSYDVKMPIPTSIVVPCSGPGVMSFTPTPDPDGTSKASDVSVTFESPGV
jgi:hypothetical protein